MSKYYNETVRLQSEKRQEWIREIRGERLQGIAECPRSAPRLASSSAFPGREDRRSEKTVSARSATEFEIKEKMEDRTGWRGQNESQTGGEEKKNGRLVGAAETSKERAEWRRLQRKNLSILGLPKRKEWPQCHTESSWQERRSRPCQKEKEQSRLFRVPDHEGGESRTLAREGGLEREHGVERVDSTVNEGRFQGGKGGQAKRASLEKVEGSMSG